MLKLLPQLLLRETALRRTNAALSEGKLVDVCFAED